MVDRPGRALPRTHPLRRAPAITVLAACAALLAACASTPTPSPGGDAAAACRATFAAVDARVARAGARDGIDAPLAGFPFLRADRLLASLSGAAGQSPGARRTWLGHLAARDAAGRAAELRVLEADAARRRALEQALDACRPLLVEETARDDRAFSAATAAARVPDDYLSSRRALGFYPLAARLALRGIARLHASESPVAGGADADGRVYALATDGVRDRAALAAAVAAAPRDALDFPALPRELLDALFAAHAPAWVVGQESGADAIGRVTRTSEGPRVDPEAPTVYRYLSHTRFEGRLLPQLNYVVWFAARPKSGPLDLLGGPLDGLTWRVTLDLDGEPLVYDSMHNCGCYHQWYPTPRLVRHGNTDGTEPPWVPLVVEGSGPPAVGLAAGSHYVRSVGPAPQRVDATLTLLDYDVLRALPGDDGRTRSLFGSDGLVHGSERLERFTFWPFGIRSAGAMRSRGHQPTAFVGRRHFDEAGIVERYFTRR
jgi:hypothetical protein